MISREGGGLKRLNLQDNHLLGNDIYSADAVLLLAEALRSPGCQLQELHLSLVNQQLGMREEDGAILGAA
eukprot:6671716-Prymnesium_polylepis.1